MEKLSSAATIPQLLRNFLIAVVVFADEFLLRNSKLFEKLRLFLVTCFLFFFPPFPNPKPFKFTSEMKKNNLEIGDYSSDSGIGRAIWELLSAMNEIPVNSRKYETVRSLAEKLIEENHRENSTILFDLNRRVLNASFRRTLNRLETAVKLNRSELPVRRGLNRVVRAAVKFVGDGITGLGGGEETADQAEKLAAELLWLAEKMTVYGFVDEAIEKWASASNLAWLSLWSEPRLQCSMVQISALLFKEANEIGMGREAEEEEKWREIKKKMVLSWLPLLCRASNGADKPVLRTAERAEVEKVLEKMISEMKEEEQEQVLSLWLHHYTSCSYSDWPDLNGSYLRCVEGNPLVTGNKEGNGDIKKIVISATVATVVTSFAIISCGLVLFCLCRQKKSPSVEGPPPVQELDESSEHVATRITKFSFAQVTKMTNNFERVIGEGGFGSVYLGLVNGVEKLAVKVLSPSSYREFKAEIQLLLRLHHKNLVDLLGYCDQGETLALIYVYMANGNLKEHISGRTSNNFIMNWGNRLKIATDSAQGLEYLHRGCSPAIIHRDIKPTNILLNDQCEAKLADFGLSKSFPMRDEGHMSTVVAGYVDPEYHGTGWLTTKSDVYSFGVLLLELLTNLPVIDDGREKAHIGDWVGFKIRDGDMSSIMDPRISDYHSGSARQYVELAMSCLHPSPADRPTMSQIVNGLKASQLSMAGNTGSSIELSMAIDTEAAPSSR